MRILESMAARVLWMVPVLASCASGPERTPASHTEAEVLRRMDPLAESYVKLVLALGRHDEDYVDAYYGPPAWKAAAASDPRDVGAIEEEAVRLEADVAAIDPSGASEIARLRHAYLRGMLRSVRARAAMLGGERYRFDEESRALYDAEAPHHDEAHFRAILEQLEEVLPGEASLAARIEDFRARFVIPPDRVDAVFRAAIDECRRRTLARTALPEGEDFRVETVHGKSWSAYNWYQGDAKSLIQVNVDLPITIDRALDLACHEGYPGHHVYNALLEQHLVRDRGWMEFSVYPLFSPQSLIAEGTANYGIDLAFPGDERVAFESEVLFPLAGLDPASAARFYEVWDLTKKLSYAGNEAARRYLNGEIDGASAVQWLVTYALMPRDLAERRVRFFDQYRSYVINYNYGQDLVAAFIERRVGPGGTKDDRWREFLALLASPRLPSGLR